MKSSKNLSNASTPSSLTTPSLSTTGPEPVVDSEPDLMESDAFDKYVDDLIDYSKTGYRRESGNRFHPEDVEPYTGPHGRPQCCKDGCNAPTTGSMESDAFEKYVDNLMGSGPVVGRDGVDDDGDVDDDDVLPLFDDGPHHSKTGYSC